jgi:hypothetical protein
VLPRRAGVACEPPVCLRQGILRPFTDHSPIWRFRLLVTRLFEVTRAGLVEQRRTARTGFHPLRESLSWFVIRPDGLAWDITQEGLPFDDATLAWIATPDQRPTFRIKKNLAFVDFALYNAANDERPDYVRVVVGKNLLITIGSGESSKLESIVEEFREIAFPGRSSRISSITLSIR